MKSLKQWNRVAHVGSFVLGYGWGGFAVLSGKVANISILAIVIGAVTFSLLLAYALSPPFQNSTDEESEPLET